MDAVRLQAVLGAGLALVAVLGARAEETPRWGVVVHGGAGVIARAKLSPEREAEYRKAMAGAAAAAVAVLKSGGDALDAVEAAIMPLEDDPLFNAGRGAVFTADGRNELDASVMRGSDRAAGAVAGVTGVRHPITLARRVMERSEHVMLVGAGAEAFAAEQGLERMDPAWFRTEPRWRQLEEALGKKGLAAPAKPDKFGTVGAVALDAKGHLAAGTSTGGTTAKRWGRVGDAPIIGAGSYADDASCAVSATGHGEYFIRASVARMICARVELLGETLQTAADTVVGKELVAMGGDGGVIAADKTGALVWSFNTSGMYRARMGSHQPLETAVFQDEGG